MDHIDTVYEIEEIPLRAEISRPGESEMDRFQLLPSLAQHLFGRPKPPACALGCTSQGGNMIPGPAPDLQNLGGRCHGSLVEQSVKNHGMDPAVLGIFSGDSVVINLLGHEPRILCAPARNGSRRAQDVHPAQRAVKFTDRLYKASSNLKHSPSNQAQESPCGSHSAAPPRRMATRAHRI